MPKRRNTDIYSYKLKNGKKRYGFRIYIGSKGHGRNRKKVETRRSGFKTYAEAEIEYNNLNAKGVNNYIKPKQMTVDDLWHKWFPYYCESGVKESTIQKCTEIYRIHIKPEFGGYYLDELTTEAISDYFYELAEYYRKFKTVFNYFHRMLEYAVDIELITRNPARASLIPKKSKVKKRDLSENFYSIQELQEFFATAKKVDEQAYVYFLILGMTGIRKSEAIALNWKDIEYENKQIYVQRTTAYGRYNKYITQLPKNNKKRHVPMPDELATVLKHYRHDLSDKLFHTAKDKYYRSMQATNWQKEIYKANPKLRKITIHGIRHTFATILNHQNGTNPKDVQVILGHSSLNMTMDVYTHSTKEGRENVREKIDKLL